MNEINKIQEEIIEEFADFETWDEKYEYIIELGFDLEKLDPIEKTEENRIIGCQSNVWLASFLDEKGRVIYRADSDAMIVKGLASLVLRTVSEQRPEEILSTEIYLFKSLGLEEHLSPTRKNGLGAMLRRIKADALRFAV